MNSYLSGKGPMNVVKDLTIFLNQLEEDTVRAQIIQIYLEDNKNVNDILMKNIKLDAEIRQEETDLDKEDNMDKDTKVQKKESLVEKFFEGLLPLVWCAFLGANAFGFMRALKAPLYFSVAIGMLVLILMAIMHKINEVIHKDEKDN